MIDPVSLTTARKIVVGLKKQQVKKKRNEGIQMYLGFNIKLLLFLT